MCTDRRRDEIDAALTAGRSIPAIAREVGLPESNLYRHRKDHLTAAATSLVHRPAALMSSIEFLEERDRDLASVQTMAITRGHTQSAVAALSQRIKIGLEIANLRGEILPKPRSAFFATLDKETAARIANSYLKHEALSHAIIDVCQK
ncbi:hypothetical protein ACPOL_3460 [Acidisarcina polymorpha]|uniref:Uncharacterized protein n=1 Tax=Acidisarcina polymorpha TaxID=2211140 RepID=A0A2Z5G261_9BACT|nr:hypothetical protein ACPOL_3460 [Acidisarcina polymorpha]